LRSPVSLENRKDEINSNMEEIRIVIVDDHDIIIDGLRSMFSSKTGFSVVGTAKNGQEAFELCEQIRPDVVIMDISMPVLNGIEATRKIIAVMPSVKILALTQHDSNEYILQMFKAGAKGYLLKNSKKAELIDAIENIVAGNSYFGKKISDIMMESFIHHDEKKDEVNEVVLTNREKEIIQLISSDTNNNQIADQLHISLRTVETHRRNIMQKLDVNSVVALVRYAIKKGLVELT